MTAMTKPSLLLTALALAWISAWSAPARADIPPSCSAFDALITCAAGDVGKPCQGGGQCYEVHCSAGAAGSTLYKCDACPTVVASADECSFADLGKACGGDGSAATCAVLPPHCITAGGKFACQTPATAKPTGPPSGGGAAGTTGGTTKSSGCDIAPNPPKPTMIGLGLVAAGLVFFLVDRKRRSRQ
jgi:hypothetical protein